VVAGTESAVLMVESEAKELSEDQMLGAVLFGHDEMQIAIQAINEFAAAAGAKPSDWVAPAHNEELRAKLKEAFEAKISEAYTIAVKQDRY
ncbi:polyribonucleotide nucleotidyltransferase, partial [Klebsiella pneumoniae]|nr:polyribonucleotide nucleotidyltransferase [Klebsiella pneumoniae]